MTAHRSEMEMLECFRLARSAAYSATTIRGLAYKNRLWAEFHQHMANAIGWASR